VAAEHSPLVSVVLCVYEGERYLEEAIASIVGQTLQDLELLVVDDGSTDRSLEIARSFTDPRVRVLARPHEGLLASLHAGFDAARGRYVARMDADDVSRPRRLEGQVEALEATGAVLAGCGYTLIDTAGDTIGTVMPALRDADLRRRLLVRMPFAGGSIICRRDALERGARPQAHISEDYEQVLRCAALGALTSAPEILYDWRIRPESTTHSRNDEQTAVAEEMRRPLWEPLPPVRSAAQLRAALAPESTDPKAARLLQAQHARTELLIAGEYARRGSPGAALRQVAAVAATGPRTWATVVGDLPDRFRNRFRHYRK
jgi:hypothetical protein